MKTGALAVLLVAWAWTRSRRGKRNGWSEARWLVYGGSLERVR